MYSHNIQINVVVMKDGQDQKLILLRDYGSYLQENLSLLIAHVRNEDESIYDGVDRILTTYGVQAKEKTDFESFFFKTSPHTLSFFIFVELEDDKHIEFEKHKLSWRGLYEFKNIDETTEQVHQYIMECL